MTVTPAPLTVAADDATRLYGGADPTLTYTITGFVNGESMKSGGLTGAATVSTTAKAGSPAGSYAISPAIGTLVAANYTVVFQPGTLTVAPAVLTVTALDQTRYYGDVNPAFPYSITGFVNNDFLDQSKLTGAATFKVPDQAQDHIGALGDYTITITRGTLDYADTNYTFDPSQFYRGKLTIQPAA